VPGFRKAFAESLAYGAGELPEEVALLAELDPIDVVAAELLGSSEPRVRRWAVWLLERGIRTAVAGAACLRSDQVARSACWTLLSHNDSRIRGLARGAVLIAAALRLVEDHVTAAMFRRVVDELAPVPVIAERMEACRRLIELGANPLAGEHCARELDLEQLIDCPECGTAFPKRDLAGHRRKEHRIFEWEGRRYDFDSLVALLLRRTVSVEADAFAARSLEELFVEQHGNGARQPLYQGLRDKLRQWPEQENWAALASGFGSAVATLSLAPKLSLAFLKDVDPICQTAGLAIFNNLDRDPPADLSRQAAVMLRRTEIPQTVCEQAAIHLLRRPGYDVEICGRALRALASRAADKLQGIELLRALEQWVGPSPVIESVCDQLLSLVRMKCPNCGISLTPPDLANHVLAEHGLILDGRNVRKPWSVAMSCLEEYAETPDSRLLERAEQMAVIASPENGRTRLWREALRRGSAPQHYLRALVDSVKSMATSLCPQCWESISTANEPPNKVHVDKQGNIQSDVVSLRRATLHGIWASVEISPWQGSDPRWVLSRSGAFVAIAVLALVPSILFGIIGLQGFVGMRPFALGTFLVGVVGMLLVALVYRPSAVEPIDVAWELVVPEVLRDSNEKILPQHSSFLASLAKVSCGRGHESFRESILNRTIRAIRHLVIQGQVPPNHLAELLHLRFDDAAQYRGKHGSREDVLNHLLRQVLEDQIPLSCLDVAMRNGKSLSHLPKDEAIAIIWRFVEDAKLAGLVPTDLISLEIKSSTLGSLLKAASVRAEDLAGFFAILDLEDSGRVPEGLLTARQLLARGKRHLFHDYTTLLAQTLPALMGDSEVIRLVVDGLIFGGRVFASPPQCHGRPDDSVRPNRLDAPAAGRWAGSTIQSQSTDGLLPSDGVHNLRGKHYSETSR
jgi:hypothetical protein